MKMKMDMEMDNLQKVSKHFRGVGQREIMHSIAKENHKSQCHSTTQRPKSRIHWSLQMQ